MNSPRADHAAVLLLDGRVLVLGGYSNSQNALASAELYDTSSGTFRPTGSMSVPRARPAAVRLRDGHVLVVGSDNNVATAAVELYDPAAGVFSPAGSLNFPRGQAHATLLGDGRVLVTGNTGCPVQCANVAEVYDPATATFSVSGAMSIARWSYAQVPLTDGRVLIIGGWDANSRATAPTSSAEVYDPATGAFSPAGTLPGDLSATEAVLLGDGRVFMCGGDAHEGYIAAGLLYDPATGQFAIAGSLPVGVIDHRVTLLRDGRVLVTGGLPQPAQTSQNQTQFYSVASGAFSAGPLMTSPRSSHAATLLSDGRVLVTGGSIGASQQQVLSSAELFQSSAASDFSLTAMNASARIAKSSDTAQFTVSAYGTSGFSGEITLACSGLAQGACSFAPAMIAGGQSTTLTVSALSSLPTGNVSFTVNGSSGGLTRSVQLTIAVADFAVAVSPPAQTITAGQKATYRLTFTPLNGALPVTLSCSGLPAGATCSQLPQSFVLASATQPSLFDVDVTTTARGLAPPVRASPAGPPLSTPLPATPLSFLLGFTLAAAALALWTAPRARLVLGACATVVVLAITLSGCGGTGNAGLGANGVPGDPLGGGTTQSGTPAGPSTLTFTVTSGPLTHPVTATLTVQ